MSEHRARKLYALTDQLQVQLRVLEEKRAPVNVRVVLQQQPADTDAVAFLVMMQASRSAQEDLRTVMAQVKQINAAKQRLQEKARRPLADEIDFEGVLQLAATLYAKQLDAEITMLLDPTSEMGELEQLRLQMAMDRLSKMMGALSNVLKKISDTASQITQNLK